MRATPWRRAVCLWAAVTVGLGGCRTPAPVATTPVHVPIAIATPPTAPTGRAQVPLAAESASAISIALGAPDRAAAAPLAGSPLPDADTRALLARLAPLPAVAATAPAMRPPSAAPPRTDGGTDQPIEFVAPGGKVIPDGPLSARAPHRVIPPLEAPQILPRGDRSGPESEITVEFAEPMVPVAAVGSVATPPIAIAPAIAGSWRWLDTRVLQFTPAAPRIPQATTVTITVPAGITAVSGATLAAVAVGTFATPGPQITGSFPSGHLRPDAPVAVQFDQDIDPAAIGKYLHVVGPHDRTLAWRPIALADATAKWAENPSLARDHAELGTRYVLLAPATAWPAGAELRVVLGKDAPSREGPGVSRGPTDTGFDIAPAFTVLGMRCDSIENPRLANVTCGANGNVTVHLSNDLDPARIEPTWVTTATDPKPNFYGSFITVSTGEAVRATVKIELAAAIVDVFGQHLAGTRALAYTTTREIYEPNVGARGGIFVLDPRFAVPQWIVEATAIGSLDVALYRVEPKDYFAYEDFESGRRATPPGTRVFAKNYPVGARYRTDGRVDLRPALGPSGTGHVIAVASSHDDFPRQRVTAWIEVTRLSLATRVDASKLYAWVHDLTPGARFLAPVAGVTTAIVIDGRPETASAVTDATGAASFTVPPPTPTTATTRNRRDDTRILLASTATDSVFEAVDYASSVRREGSRWYVTDDRFTYRPGEPVSVKGWIRDVTPGVNPDLAMPARGDVAYALVDRRGTQLAAGTAPLSAQGGFDLTATIPANANTGDAHFNFTLRGETYTRMISIAEFRTPTFVASMTETGETLPLLVGEAVELTASAKYYTGGVLGGAAVGWHAVLRSARYAPPGWDGFAFTPPYAEDDRGSESAEVDTTLDAAGSRTATFGIARALHGKPAVLSVSAAITDLDRRTIRASSREIVVHPSAYYVGIRRADPSDDLELIVSDPDGAAVAGVAIDVALAGMDNDTRYRYGHRADRLAITPTDLQHCKLTSATTPVRCHYTPRATLAYTATASVLDGRGRPNAAEYAVPWWSREPAAASLAVTSDKALYRPGETAQLSIHSLIVPSRATVTFAREGVIAQQDVALTAPDTTVALPIGDAFVENVHVIVDRYARRLTAKGAPRDLPEIDTAELDLAVDREAMRLATTVRPTRAAVEPGGEATFDVRVERPDHTAVAGAEVAVIVVDEAVLALSTRTHGDPLEPFYRHVGDGTRASTTFRMVADSEADLAGDPGFTRRNLDDPTAGALRGRSGVARGRSASYPSVSMGAASPMGGAVRMRKDFRATAVFAPRLVTDAAGRATVSVTMPDNLTRYRVVALASSAVHQFGKGESTIVARREVTARAVAPRFLTQGDAFALPVVVQNLSSTTRTVDVAVRAANLVATGPSGGRIVVPPGARGELRFAFKTAGRGTATIQAIAVAGGIADASEVAVPVYAPATTEAFATYGVVDEAPRIEQLIVPKDVLVDVGGVEAEVSSTQLQSITDAYWYLYAYPYECAEQRSSRMLATAALADVLDAFATPGRPTKEALASTRAADLERLKHDQNSDGSWGYFSDMHGDPYVTFQVLAALAAANDHGNEVKAAIKFTDDHVNRVLGALANRTPKRTPVPPDTIGLAAAGLVALAATGADVSARAQRLHDLAPRGGGGYSLDAKARLLGLVAKRPAQAAMRARLLADLVSSIHQTAASATVASNAIEGERLLLPSDLKSSALVLDALIREAPTLPVIAKLARGVLDARIHGRWRSTQDNLVALQAMRRFFDAYEATPPSYTGKLWLGTAGYAEQSFVGRSTVRGHVGLGFAELAPGATHDIAFAKVGPGRMYYRLGITYAPARPDLPPLDAGFVVRRTYTAVDAAGDVAHLPNGSWKIKLGAKVLVQLEALNTTRRDDVALIDQLPAGFEIVDSSLAISEREAAGTSDHWDHLNWRDDRAEAFAMELAPGSHRLEYTVRATTPGTFVTAPAKAEEMYAPETFGRSAGTTVVIE